MQTSMHNYVHTFTASPKINYLLNYIALLFKCRLRFTITEILYL